MSEMTAILGAQDVVADWPGRRPAIALPAAGTGYRLWLSVTAMALVGLLLGIIGFVGVVGFVAIWHVYQAFFTWGEPAFVVFHIPMALLGLLLCVLVLKPLILRPAGPGEDAVEISSKENSRFFRLVHTLAEAAGAQPPEVIEVDIRPNAVVILRRRGLLGLQLVLRIGLPVVAAMTARQVAGVIGHELGHFRQRTGIRTSYAIRVLSAFLASIVYERDRLDLSLLRLRLSRSRSLRFLSFLMILPVEAARGVLWIMLTLADALTCLLCRRMEYDADQVEAAFSGADDFARTSGQLVGLQCAWDLIRHELPEQWQHRRVPADLPAAIVSSAGRLQKRHAEALQQLGRRAGRWFHTHPSEQERIAAVRASAKAAALTNGPSARELFGDFHALCEAATLKHYQCIDKEHAQKLTLVSAEQYAQRGELNESLSDALDRFSQGVVIPAEPFLPRTPGASVTIQSSDDIRQEIEAVRGRLRQQANGAEGLMEKYEQARRRLSAARAAVAISNGCPKQMRSLDFERSARGDLRIATNQYDEISPKVAQLTQLCQRRLDLAWSLLADPAVVAAVEQSRAQRTGVAPANLLCLSNTLRQCLDHGQEINLACSEWSMLQNIRQDPQAREAFASQSEIAAARIMRLTAQCITALDKHTDPFAPQGVHRTLADACTGLEISDEGDDLLSKAGMLLEGLFGHIGRVMAESAALAESIETAAGFAPLPAPDRSGAREAARQAQEHQQRQSERRFYIGYTVRGLAGTGMLAAMLWLSISPPAIPDFSNGYAYRPASFTPSFHAYTPVQLAGADRPRIVPTVQFQQYFGTQAGRVDSRGVVMLPPGFRPPPQPGMAGLPGQPQPQAGRRPGLPPGLWVPGLEPYSPEPPTGSRVSPGAADQRFGPQAGGVQPSGPGRSEPPSRSQPGGYRPSSPAPYSPRPGGGGGGRAPGGASPGRPGR